MKHINKDKTQHKSEWTHSEATPASSSHLDAETPRYCEVCGAAIRPELGRCIICPSQRGPSPSPPDLEEQARSMTIVTPIELLRQKKRPDRMAQLLILLIAVGVIGVGVYRYFIWNKLLSTYSGDNTIIYISGGEFKIKIPSLTEPMVIGNAPSGALSAFFPAEKSADNRFIAYLGDARQTGDYPTGSLYLLDIPALAGDTPNESVPVAENVIAFRFVPEGNRIIYLTLDGGLFICDYSAMLKFWVQDKTEILQIDSGVKGIGDFSANRFLYYKGESAGVTKETFNDNKREIISYYDLYIYDLSGKVAPIFIDRNVGDVLDYTSGFDRLIYIKKAENELYDAMLFLNNPARIQALARAVSSVIDSDAAKARLLYLVQSSDFVLSFEDLIEDDLAQSDRLMREPRMDDYGVISADDPSVAYFEPEDLDENYSKYLEDLEAYEHKRERDVLREELRRDTRNYTNNSLRVYDLYYFSDGASRLLDSNIYTNLHGQSAARGSLKLDYVLYKKGSFDSIDNKLKLSLQLPPYSGYAVSQYDWIHRYLSSNMADVICYLPLATGNAQIIFDENGREHSTVIHDFFVTDKLDGIYYTATAQNYRNGAYAMYYSPLTAGVSTAPSAELVDERDTFFLDKSLTGISELPSTGFFYIAKAPSDNTYEMRICHAVGYSGTEIASEVYPISLDFADDGTLFYSREVNRNMIGTNRFYMYDGQERFISSDVVSYVYHGGNFLYLLKKSSQPGKFDLYSYNSGETVLIEENISQLQFTSSMNR